MPALGTTTYGGAPYAGPPVSNSPAVEVDGGDFPTLVLEIAPGYGPNDANPVWVDIARKVTQITTRRGRQRILNKFEAGTMNVTLDNKTGEFSPFNGSSPYAGLIVPGLPIRFRTIWNGTSFPKFTGYVESWPLTWPSASDSQVTVTALDAMKFLNLKTPGSINTYAALVGADAPYTWYRCNDPVGTTSLTDAGSAHLPLPIFFISGYPFMTGQPATILFNPTFQNPGAIVGDTDASIDLATGTAAFFAPLPSTIAAAGPVSIEVWANVSKAPESNGAGTGTAGIAGLIDGTGSGGYRITIREDGMAIGTGTGATVKIDDHQWHHLVYTFGGGVGRFYVDGVQVGSTSTPATNPLFGALLGAQQMAGVLNSPAGVLEGAVDEFAVYQYVLSDTQVAGHYVAGRQPRVNETTGARIGYLASYSSIPAAAQVIDAGNTLVQGATDRWLKDTLLKQMQDQADTEGGDLFVDASGRLVFFDRYHTSRSPYSSVSLTLGDSGVAPEEPYRLESLTVSYDDQDIVNEVTVTPEGLSPQTAADSASQVTYGKRTMSRSSLAFSAQDALNQATFFLNTQKTPLPRIDSVTVVPTDDPQMLWGPVLGSDLLTRLEVIRRPKDGVGSTFDQTALIEGIQERVTKGTWQTTWQLSSTDATVFWIIGDPIAGRIVDGASQIPPVAIGY